MKLLLDANISWRIADGLSQHFEECLHVNQCGLPIPAKDIDIWNFARDNNFIIVTNDDDFLHFLITKRFPPKVVLLRTGNQHRHFIEKMLIRHKPEIQQLASSKEYGLLEIY